jgi:hypothetical protein
LAFPEDYTAGLSYFDYAMNLLFGIDIVISFYTAYYDSDFQIIDNQRVIVPLMLNSSIDDSQELPKDMVHHRHELCHPL